VVRHDVSSYFGDRRTAVGYATDFIGHVDIEPMLNDDEMAYLQAFTSSRRYARPGGPYDVPPNPAADHERADDIPVRIFNEVAPGSLGSTATGCRAGRVAALPTAESRSSTTPPPG
jgi:hypothetical protein